MHNWMNRNAATVMAGTISLAAGLGPTGAAANDSTAAIGAGGLELIANYQVELVREDLTIAIDRVTVRYLFRNTAEVDVDTLVAFPMPEVDMRQMYETDLGPLDTGTPNYMDFSVTVDGGPVEAEWETRTTVLGLDVTDRMLELGLPVSGFDLAMFDTLSALPAETRTELQAEGIAQFDEYDGVVEAYPTWTFQTIYYWQQRFPAGAETVIEHSYRPVTGAQFFGSYEAEDVRRGDSWFQNRFCLSEETAAAAEEIVGDESYLLTRHVDYILVTAKNWLGPIGTFHLTIETGAPENLVALCLDGLERTGPTTLEVTLTDFVPEDDLAVLFIEGRPMH